MDVELVTEYAKELVWEGRETELLEPDQLYILSQQYKRVSRLQGKVEYVITDSPLLVSLVYTPKNPHSFMKQFVYDLWDTFDNISFVLQRSTAFNEEGRAHTLEQSLAVDNKILEVLDWGGIHYQFVDVNSTTVDVLLNKILLYHK